MIDRVNEFFSSQPRTLWLSTLLAIAALYGPDLICGQESDDHFATYAFFMAGGLLLLACVGLAIQLAFSKERRERLHGFAFLALFVACVAVPFAFRIGAVAQ